MCHHLFIQLKPENLKTRLALSGRGLPCTAALRDASSAHTQLGFPWVQKVLMDPSLWGGVFISASFERLALQSRGREFPAVPVSKTLESQALVQAGHWQNCSHGDVRASPGAHLWPFFFSLNIISSTFLTFISALDSKYHRLPILPPIGRDSWTPHVHRHLDQKQSTR